MIIKIICYLLGHKMKNIEPLNYCPEFKKVTFECARCGKQKIENIYKGMTEREQDEHFLGL